MVMYEVHSHPIRQKYKTHICSRATFFQIFVVFLTFIPPLIIAFVTYGRYKQTIFLVNLSLIILSLLLTGRNFVNVKGFWLKESSYREQPDVHYKHELLLILQGSVPGSYLAYSTFQNFNRMLQQNVRIPLIKVRSLLF